MSVNKKKDGFFQNVGNFFKRVNQQDTMRVGDGNVTILDQPQSEEEREKYREIQVFRQFLQQKNWNIKHTELFEEYRRMDRTFPIINAALRLYSQEVCLTGDTVVKTPAGDKTIKSLFDEKKTGFYVSSVDTTLNRVGHNMVEYIKSNGVKKVYKVTVDRNISSENTWDKKLDATFKCTDNHKIMIAPDTFKELKDLKPGDQISSMYYFKDPSCGCLEQRFQTSAILSIEEAGSEEVFDLVNVAPFHHFMIKLTDSFYVSVHNCTKDGDGNVIEIISDNKKVKALLEECFFDNLKLNSTSYLHVRSLLKFGNHFSYLDTRPGIGVVDLIHLPPEALRIQLLQDQFALDEFVYNWIGNGGGVNFDSWQIVHWKNIEDLETEPYGQSILRSVVDTYRRIVLMREAMIVYRITRAPQRLLFKIDTTGLDPDAALALCENMKKQMYKKPLVNPTTGEIDHKYNVLSIEENLYWPSYEGDTSDVKTLEGAGNMDQLEDYKIIQEDLFAGLLIPKSYLTFEEDLCLRGNTSIKTLEGEMNICDLPKFMEENPDKKVYTLSTNKFGIIFSGRILWCKPTKKVTTLIRVTINEEHVVEATHNHPFLMRDLNYKRADLLMEGDSLKGIYDENYIVTSVEEITLEEEEDVYDLEVEEYHNFALSNGIFVHNSNKAALAQEDLRFAGAVRQYQSHYIEGLVHIAIVHLHLNGCSKEELASFSIQMNINSTLAEKTKNEILDQRFDLAKKAWDSDNTGLNIMSFTQVLKEILHFTDEEISKCIKDQMIEKRLIWRMGELIENGTYHDPEIEKKKLLGMNSENDIFSNLTFESKDFSSSIGSILNEKLDKEIAVLVKKPIAQPTRKMIASLIRENANYSGTSNKMLDNINKTIKDIE